MAAPRKRKASPPVVAPAAAAEKAIKGQEAAAPPSMPDPIGSMSKQMNGVNPMSLRPLHDRVIVKRLEEEKKSAGGILIPDSAAEKPLKAEVIAVGPGKRTDDGKLQEPAVKAGDTVLIGKYSGTEVKIDGAELVVLREDDILAVIVK